MPYCRNCGTKLVDGAKFCQKCGYLVAEENHSSPPQQEYAGKIYKCPNCGEILKSFEINCPACGFELRDVRSTSAVREFALKLEAIESRRESDKSKRFFSNSNSFDSISKTDEQKINLIKSFAIPNSKEDMLEFMILATSNINPDVYSTMYHVSSKTELELNSAWIAKAQQVYEKAKQSHSEDDTFSKIQSIYDKCFQQVDKEKKHGKNFTIFCFLLPLLLIAGSFILSSIAAPIQNKKENERLENIIVEVQQALDDKDYQQALRIADSIDCQSSDVEMKRTWNLEKEYWIDEVLTQAEKEGVSLNYMLSTDGDQEKQNIDRETNDGLAEEFKKGIQSHSEEIENNISEFDRIMSDTDTADSHGSD